MNVMIFRDQLNWSKSNFGLLTCKTFNMRSVAEWGNNNTKGLHYGVFQGFCRKLHKSVL